MGNLAFGRPYFIPEILPFERIRLFVLDLVNVLFFFFWFDLSRLIVVVISIRHKLQCCVIKLQIDAVNHPNNDAEALIPEFFEELN